ncbi:hypothetical protein [Streptomyces kanamyceticus]|uniref:Uncharacterized protein n=1 Tax=Streptomyces kanamyceticus TaxID=1967 RepID=A0A5J6GIE9_STRKN|nr:hypothetical protein [Streptomyces kanamyceticus]QEU93705.1 hypothetical protein CP970_24835 [Streptomyces kanamyceticus]
MSTCTKSARAATLFAAFAVLAATVGAASASTVGAASASSSQDAPATGSGPVTSTLKGSARLAYPVPTEDIRVSVDARSDYKSADWSLPEPGKSSGTFRIVHRGDPVDGKPGWVNWGEFKVDCLSTGGPTATVTGRIVRAGGDTGAWDDYVKRGVRMGVSFYVGDKSGDKKGGAPSRVGITAGNKEGEPMLTKCMASAADSPVIEGGYTLKDKFPAR